jgi:hypothetical protein
LLPILLSAVFVFIASAIINMAPLWHKNDYPRVPNEDALRAALRPLALPPGEYMVPRAQSSAEAQSPAFIARAKEGPNLILTVLPNEPYRLVRNLTHWFIYLVLVSVFAAYVAGRALPAGTDYRVVFRFVGTTAFLGLTVALWQMSIWYRRSWGLSVKSTVDGLIYALLMGGTFGWLWPQ